MCYLPAFALTATLCGLAAAAGGCPGGSCQPSVGASMLQARAIKRQIAVASAESRRDLLKQLHAKTDSYLELLTELAAGGKKTLPGTLKTFVDTIKNHSQEIKLKLSAEHATESGVLSTDFSAIGQCDTDFSNEIGVIEDAGPNSAKSLAVAGKASLCQCRRLQAVASVEKTGCDDQLTCYSSVMQSKLDSKRAFLYDSNNQATQMYSSGAGVGQDLCANSGDWQNVAGSSDDAKAVEWFVSQKAVWDTHWDGKKSALEGLISQYTSAKNIHDALRDGASPIVQGKGCSSLNQRHNDLVSNCTTLQVRATMNQCFYRAQTQDKCDTYTQCRVDAEKVWSNSKQRESTASADRKEAWVAAGKIECLIDMFSEHANGTLQIDDSNSANCEAVTCDTTCVTALDLSTSLARVPSARAACSLPDSPCANPGWNPTCAATVKANWGDTIPEYLVGTRIAPDCGGSPTAVTLSSLEAADSCQPCSGLTGWNSSNFTPFTPAPTMAVPTPAPTAEENTPRLQVAVGQTCRSGVTNPSCSNCLKYKRNDIPNGDCYYVPTEQVCKSQGAALTNNVTVQGLDGNCLPEAPTTGAL